MGSAVAPSARVEASADHRERKHTWDVHAHHPHRVDLRPAVGTSTSPSARTRAWLAGRMDPNRTRIQQTQLVHQVRGQRLRAHCPQLRETARETSIRTEESVCVPLRELRRRRTHAYPSCSKLVLACQRRSARTIKPRRVTWAPEKNPSRLIGAGYAVRQLFQQTQRLRGPLGSFRPDVRR